MNCELMLTYDTPAYMFNVNTNHPSRQTESRNLTDQKTLPIKWGTYMKLVTKYQTSAINICWEKCDEKLAYLGPKNASYNMAYLYEACDQISDSWDNMKQPAAILVLQYWYTILVIPVFYQYLPVSAILVQILVNTSIPVSSRIFQYLQY